MNEQNRLRRLEIRHQLNLAGSSFTAIAKSLKLSVSTVQTVANGRTRSARVEKAIADTIGKELWEIWPEYYSDQTKETP